VGANPGADPCAAPPSDAAAGRGALVQALETAREAAERIVAQHGAALDYADRLKVSRAFGRVLIPGPQRPRGRKRSAAITATYEDSQRGMCGQRLYQKHIRGYSGMNRYRRESARRRLNEAIRSRSRRERRE
jgi:hypothetical protein